MLRDVPRARPFERGGPLPPFDRVVRDHGPAVLRFCAARVGAERAEDCFQESMLAALRAYDQLRDPDAIRSWLFAIAARKAVDAHRAGALMPHPTDVGEASAGVEDSAGGDEALWEQVRALPDKQGQAVTLRYRADLTHAEIAEVMQTSEPAARRNVFEGLKRLRQEGVT
jgi:RNA polymerase sigma factor (sigma-70 family)